jgi:hypothetical protein
MPQAEKQLRDKFMTEDDLDGIGICEKIILNAGGQIADNAYIHYAGDDQEVQDAIDFLCQEWDYASVDHMELVSIRGDLQSMDEL